MRAGAGGRAAWPGGSRCGSRSRVGAQDQDLVDDVPEAQIDLGALVGAVPLQVREISLDLCVATVAVTDSRVEGRDARLHNRHALVELRVE